MPPVKVTFVNDQTSERMEDATVDDSSTVGEVVQHLIDHSLLSKARDGSAWILDIKGKTTLTQSNATLASGGVANNDVIIARLPQVGGIRGRRSERT